MNKRIGIFSGVFDPVHKGHISIALEAVKQASLDKVYFLAEAQPRRKTAVTHVSHRIAMLKLATVPYPKFSVLELPDRQFSVAKTWPRLAQRFPGSELLFIAGSDMLEHMPEWPLVGRMLENMGLIIAARDKATPKSIHALLPELPRPPRELFVVVSPAPTVSSGQIRGALRMGKPSDNVLPSIRQYIAKHWLYSALPNNS